MKGNERTIDSINEIVNAIENDPDILRTNPDFCKGIKGKSLFLEQPYFNMLKDLPCEYMHLLCLGVVKRLVELGFKVGENRDRVTNRPLTDPRVFNLLIALLQVPREFGRRCRSMDFGVMKACEFRNILIFFFPVVLDCIDDQYKKEKQIWLHLAYMIRACVIPNDEFHNVDEATITRACEKFYKLYQDVFGQKNCSYSVHVMSSHLLKIRQNRPLTYKSAFKFESFFSEMRNLFQAGTTSPLKQILENCYVKRSLEHHVCEKTTFYDTYKDNKKNPGKENNYLVYVFDENKELTMYIIKEKIDDQHFLCCKQGKYKVTMNLTPEYDWSTVGVYNVGPVSEETITIPIDKISGKVLKVNNYLITCPLNVLHEQ